MTDDAPHDPLPPALQCAAHALRACRDCPPLEASAQLREAVVAVTRARNRLIAPAPGGAGRPDLRLDRVNGLLSMMSSLEFPLSGLARDRLDETIGEIEALRNG